MAERDVEHNWNKTVPEHGGHEADEFEQRPYEPAPSDDEGAVLPVEDDEAPAGLSSEDALEASLITQPAEDAPDVLGAEGDVVADGEPAVEPPPAVDIHAGKNWYIIHTYSGFEKKVKESLQSRAQAFGFAHQIGEILIPEEDVVEVRNNKKQVSKRLLYPGYVMVQMEMNDELWHQIKNTPRVTGFVGGGNTPVPLSADEVNGILYRQTTTTERPRPKVTFEKGETVRINDGPFTNFSGKVDEINTERNTLRVLVTIFGRATPVELDFLQVEKI